MHGKAHGSMRLLVIHRSSSYFSSSPLIPRCHSFVNHICEEEEEMLPAKRFVASICMCVLILIPGSLGVPIRAQPAIVAKFVARSQTFKGTTIPYRLFIPDSYNP